MVNRIFVFGQKGKVTSMRVEFCLLCDYIDVTDRKLFNIYGGGIHRLSFDKLPEKRPLTLAFAIEYDPIQDGGFHKLETRVIDSNGKDSMNPEIVDATFPIDRRFYGMDIKLRPAFKDYGEYSVELSIDGHHLTSIPLSIVSDD